MLANGRPFFGVLVSRLGWSAGEGDASASGPTRPANMRTTRMSCAECGRFRVIPVDRPTVPKAEVASKKDVVGGELAQAL